MKKERNPYLINRAFNSFLLAAVLATASSNLAVVIDGIIVGQLLGSDALAAINLSMPLMQLIFTFVLLLSVGNAILSAMAIGRGESKVANSYFSLSLILSAVCGVALMGAGLLFAKDITSMLNSAEALQGVVESYITPIMLSAPIYFLLPTLCTFMRIDGAVKLTVWAMIVANVVNISFDLILISGCGMGIAGSSIATTIGNCVGILIILSHFIRKKNNIKIVAPQLRDLNLSKALILGLPTAIASALMTVKLITANSFVLEIEGVAGASYLAVSMSLMMIVSLFVGGVVQTSQPLVGVLIGQEDHKGVLLLTHYAIKVLLLSVVAVVLMIEVMPITISQLFGVDNLASVNEAALAIRLVVLSFLPFALIYYLVVVYQLNGNTKLSIGLSITQPMMVIVVFFVISNFMPKMIWSSFIIAELVTLILLLVVTTVIRGKNSDIEPLTLLKHKADSLCCEFSVDAANKDSLGQTVKEIDKFLAENNIDQQRANKIRLFSEEVVSNILQFGFSRPNKHFIDIRLVEVGGKINLSIKDDGTPFNPLLKDNIGDGIGLKIVQNPTFKAEYKYLFYQNTVFLKGV